MTGTRITVIFDEATLKKLRDVQANLIQETQRNWSFSKTLSIVSSIGLGVKNFDPIIEKIIEQTNKEPIKNET